MTSPNSNYSEIITTAIESRNRTLADNVESNNALLARLKQRGRKKTFSGGTKILEEITYAENGTAKYYSGYETIDITPQDVITAAEYEIKQAVCAVSISGLETIQNSGKERMIDLLSARMENAEISMMNLISEGVYSDGTGSNGKQITGLQAMISDSPSTGTLGGISRVNYSFWRNQRWDWSAESGAPTPGPTTIQNAMNTLYNRCTRGRDVPDLIIFDNTYYGYYQSSVQALERFEGNTQLADLGFRTLKFLNADVVLDGGIGGDCPSEHGYFINSRYLKYRPFAGREFVPIGGERMSTNQDAVVRLIAWAGNMTCSGPQFQGVLED